MLPRMIRHASGLYGLLLLTTATQSLAAQDWPHWRGPHYNGSTEAKNLPADFGIKERVRWEAPLPGPGACTPIIVGERVFLSSTDPEREQLVAICLDRKTGKVRWQQDTKRSGPISDGGGRGGMSSNYASPSPATDGKHLVFFFGNGDLVGFDYEGKELWRRNIQEDYGRFAFQWTFSASPTIVSGKLFLPVLQRDEPVGRGRGRRGNAEDAAERKPIDSFLLAMDPATGKTIYRHVRPSPARAESLESYTTAIPVTVGDATQLLIAGGDVLTGHDPDTGKELFRWGTWNDGHRQRSWRLVPTVVTGAGIAAVCAPKRAPVYGVALGGKGELPEDACAWQSEGRANPVSSDVPTPAFHDGHFYVLSDVRHALSKVDAKSGKVAWSVPLPRYYDWRASPTIADGKVFLMNHNAEVVVADATTGKILHRTLMGEEDDDLTRSSIAVAYDSLFIRTNAKLYCIGK